MYNYRLLDLLEKYGDVYIIGSYRMGIMPIHFNGEFRIENELAFLGFETKISGDRL